MHYVALHLYVICVHSKDAQKQLVRTSFKAVLEGDNDDDNDDDDDNVTMIMPRLIGEYASITF